MYSEGSAGHAWDGGHGEESAFGGTKTQQHEAAEGVQGRRA